MDWIGLFYSPVKLLVGHPIRFWAIAIAFALLFSLVRTLKLGRAWPLLWAAGVWSIFALWEWLMVIQAADIRVDLFLSYPVLLFITLWALGRSFVWPRPPRSSHTQAHWHPPD